MKIGLRVDVDTLRGTRIGVPNLLDLFARHSIRTTFFFSVGPDNMGRHLFRLIRPGFLKKMARTSAPVLYGWDILLRGTFSRGPVIAEKAAKIIRAASLQGHETGLHAYDHYTWQAHLDKMNSGEIHEAIEKGFNLLEKVTGKPPESSAAPAWKCNDLVLTEKAGFPFVYNSDCRGKNIFYPVVRGIILSQPQIPVTLPTYDEVIGREGITNQNYIQFILSGIRQDKLNVLTVHAEVEGISCLDMFEGFIVSAKRKGISFVPLRDLLNTSDDIPSAGITGRIIAGRDGLVAYQEE